jgi:hypothetical protein
VAEQEAEVKEAEIRDAKWSRPGTIDRTAPGGSVAPVSDMPRLAPLSLRHMAHGSTCRHHLLFRAPNEAEL